MHADREDVGASRGRASGGTPPPSAPAAVSHAAHWSLDAGDPPPSGLHAALGGRTDIGRWRSRAHGGGGAVIVASGFMLLAGFPVVAQSSAPPRPAAATDQRCLSRARLWRVGRRPRAGDLDRAWPRRTGHRSRWRCSGRQRGRRDVDRGRTTRPGAVVVSRGTFCIVALRPACPIASHAATATPASRRGLRVPDAAGTIGRNLAGPRTTTQIGVAAGGIAV
jgi:hypothetical protein